jgi:glycosyltransferase involved in cell wall biosynthesis
VRELGEKRYVAFVGRLVDIKGVTTLLDAWARVDRQGLQLRIAGDGPLRELVEERSRSDSTLSYLGWLEEKKVFDLMARAEAVLVPSEWYEGLPLVILRSLAVGTPLIVSDLKNFSTEVLEDDAGEAFAVGDSAALAHVLTRLVDSPERWLQRRANARLSYEQRYSPPANLHRLEEVYAAVRGSSRI